MKKIFTLIFLFIILFGTSCKKNNNNNNNTDNDTSTTIKITLADDEMLKNYISYSNEYIINKNETFNFPKIEKEIYIYDELQENTSSTLYTRYIHSINFLGWENDENEIIKEDSIKLSKDENYTPKYTISTKTYQLELITNGVNVNKANNFSLDKFILPIIEDENYIFNGWYYNDSFLGNSVSELPLSKLTQAVTLYAKLTPTVKYVNSLITNIPDQFTIFDIEKIDLAYNLYKKLPYKDKKLVENYDKLKNAYAQIDNLKEAYNIYNQLNTIYEKEKTPILKEELDQLFNTLNNIEENIKNLIPNLDYQKLENISKDVTTLYEMYINEAQEFDKKIAKIPIFQELYYEKEIISLYNEYQNLDNNLKTLLKADQKLITLKKNLENLHNKSTLYYLNPTGINNVYTSKTQFFEAFFTDFYYYIVSYHDLSYLKENNINKVSDFINLAKNFNGGGTSNLYGIGNLAGRYLLEKDVNGIIENQSDNAFFGFLYRNNLYQDVLPFFTNFFAYWRIDEGYANKTNYGADIYAESWAPTVDIAKFFYYNEETSYVKSDRMIDCLTNVASVVYNFNEIDALPILKLRGYKFEGWYDNENYEGSPITDISQTANKTLYAKWTIDQDQSDLDKANFVDVYINNLTTQKAIVNDVTVGYVKNMYNNLSEKGKKLVKYYDILIKLIKDYI